MMLFRLAALPAVAHWLCTGPLHYALPLASLSLTPLRIHSFHLPASLHPAAKENISTLHYVRETHAKIGQASMRTADQLSLWVILFRAAAPYSHLSERTKGETKRKKEKDSQTFYPLLKQL